MVAAKPYANLRDLPSVDALLRTAGGRSVIENEGSVHAASLAREVIAELREKLKSGANELNNNLLSSAEEMLIKSWRGEKTRAVRRVINATGVIIHTNLGRAPLSGAARQAIISEASGYCTLEYDVQTG